MSQKTPVYEFVPLPNTKKSPIRGVGTGGIFFIFGIVFFSFFWFTKESAHCSMNGRTVPCDELILPFSIICSIFSLFGLGIMISGFIRPKEDKKATSSDTVYRCFQDRIVLAYEDCDDIVLERDNMESIHFKLKKKEGNVGFISIKAKEPIEIHNGGDWFTEEDHIVLENVPNVQDVYYKIKYLYNLSDDRT